MKLATITIYSDEWFRLEAWKKLYEIYRDEVYLHIIINNGKIEDNEVLCKEFPNSKIIYSSSKNMIFSYNLGVKEALKDKDIDAIMQITNDIKIEKGALTILYKQLMEDNQLAVIGPVMLKKDSNEIESFGYMLKRYYGDSIPLYRGMQYNDLKEKFKYVSIVPGGTIMVKRSAYEKFGYQDEKIHMYSDERDMYIRFDKLGYKEGVLCTVKAWHQHIFNPGMKSRNTMATYLTARNRMYITSKHNNAFIIFSEFTILFFRYLTNLITNLIRCSPSLEYNKSAIKGLIDGYKGDMSKTINMN